MRKFLAALIATAVIFTALPSYSATWKSFDLVVRRSGNALPNQTNQEIQQGFIDSSFIYNGATTRSDTVYVRGDFSSRMFQQVDSLEVVRLQVLGSQAFASGESLYVTFDGDDGSSFTALGNSACGRCMTGGFNGSSSLIPGTNQSVSKGYNAAGQVAGTASGTGELSTLGTYYGNFKFYPRIRIRVRSDTAAAPVNQLIRYRLWVVVDN